MKSRRDFPHHSVTRLGIRVRFCETDQMGIVHHSNYVPYLEAGRLEYLRRRDYNYRGMNERGFHMAVIEMSLRYRKAALFDDELIVETRPTAITRVTVEFSYRILRASREAGEELIAEGTTLLACVGDDNKPRALPDDVREVLFSPEVSAE
jgi:acyl-CoA thioester hydrolase